jgi:hypothetical protein
MDTNEHRSVSIGVHLWFLEAWLGLSLPLDRSGAMVIIERMLKAHTNSRSLSSRLTPLQSPTQRIINWS